MLFELNDYPIDCNIRQFIEQYRLLFQNAIQSKKFNEKVYLSFFTEYIDILYENIGHSVYQEQTIRVTRFTEHKPGRVLHPSFACNGKWSCV